MEIVVINGGGNGDGEDVTTMTTTRELIIH